MDEACFRESRKRQAAWKGWGASCDHLRDVDSMCSKRMDDVHETLVTGVGLGAALRDLILREMPVIVMQAPELQSGTGNGARQLQDRVGLIIRNSGAVHPGIDIDEDANWTAAPLAEL